MIIANKRAFSALPDDVKTAIQNAAKAAEDRGWKMSEELNGQHKKTLAEKGITVSPPTDAMKAELKKIGETMAAEWAKRAGAEGEKILADFRK